MTSTLHLFRRFVGSLDPRPLARSDLARARGVLSTREFELWSSMPLHDRRHALLVLRRFDDLVPAATGAERAAALLHDVGKLRSNLGRLGRVAATLLGARGTRFTAYHEHETLGSRMLEALGSDERTVALVAGRTHDAVAEALRRADDV